MNNERRMAGDIQLLTHEPEVMAAVERIQANEQSIEELNAQDWSGRSLTGYQAQTSELPFR